MCKNRQESLTIQKPSLLQLGLFIKICSTILGIFRPPPLLLHKASIFSGRCSKLRHEQHLTNIHRTWILHLNVDMFIIKIPQVVKHLPVNFERCENVRLVPKREAAVKFLDLSTHFHCLSLVGPVASHDRGHGAILLFGKLLHSIVGVPFALFPSVHLKQEKLNCRGSVLNVQIVELSRQ